MDSLYFLLIKIINEFQQIKSKANSTNNHQESQLEQKTKREEEQKKIEITVRLCV